jgi:hypothetical protein
MKEQLITFETAKLAKERGFDLDSKGRKNCMFFASNGRLCDKVYDFDNVCLAPTQSLLQKWLREVHKLYITTRPYKLTNRYQFFVTITSEEDNFTFNKFDSYEEALEKGLEEALKLI